MGDIPVGYLCVSGLFVVSFGGFLSARFVVVNMMTEDVEIKRGYSFEEGVMKVFYTVGKNGREATVRQMPMPMWVESREEWIFDVREFGLQGPQLPNSIGFDPVKRVIRNYS